MPDVPPVTDPPAPPPPAPGPPGPDLKAEIRSVLREMFGDAPPQEPPASPEAKKPPRTQGDITEWMEQKATEALDKVFRNRAHEEEHEKLRKPPPVEPPEKPNRLRKALWGER